MLKPTDPNRLLILGALLIAVAIGAIWYLNGAEISNAPVSPGNGQVACTMEAKLCPGGSYVGRTGPNCEFAACPEASSGAVDASEWKTYANSQYGFSFKYPTDWIVANTGQLQGKPSDDALISFDKNPQNLLAQQYYSGQYGKNFFADQNTETSTTMLGGLLAYVVNPVSGQAGGSHILVPREGYFVNISILTGNPVFKEILSTFKFIQ